MPDQADRSETSVLVGDLANRPLDAACRDALITDLLAAVTAAGQSRPDRRHMSTFGTLVRTRVLLTRSGAVLRPTPDRTAAAPSPPGAGGDLATVRAGTARADRAIPGLPEVEVVHGDGRPGGLLTADAALSSGRLTRHAGHRIDPAHIGAGGHVPVVGPDELLNPSSIGRRTVAAADLARYPAVRLTRPGDVVFCTSPRPAAWADWRGGSVVVAPAKVLRIAAPELIPAVLADDINRCPPTAKAFRSWTFRVVGPSLAVPLAAALHRQAEHCDVLQNRLLELDQLRAALIAGVTSGALAIPGPPGDAVTAGSGPRSSPVPMMSSRARRPHHPNRRSDTVPPRARTAAKDAAPSTMKELKDTLWKAADKLRGSMDASQYKDVILGLVFLKYVSDAFDERREQIRAELASPTARRGPDRRLVDDIDEYTGSGVFWVPAKARWTFLAENAKGCRLTPVDDRSADR